MKILHIVVAWWGAGGGGFTTIRRKYTVIYRMQSNNLCHLHIDSVASCYSVSLSPCPPNFYVDVQNIQKSKICMGVVGGGKSEIGGSWRLTLRHSCV